jgi:hypothetical protein
MNYNGWMTRVFAVVLAWSGSIVLSSCGAEPIVLDAFETSTAGDGDGDGDGDGHAWTDGEDDCAGPDDPAQCEELASAAITSVVLDPGADGIWSPGETLIATVTYASTGAFINYPAVVSQTDNSLVTVAWVSGDAFGVDPAQPVVYQVEFTADPTIAKGTVVGLRIAAANGLGQVTGCDCPAIVVDAWVGSTTIE